MRRLGWLGCVLMSGVAMGQTATTLVEPPPPLLGPVMGGVARQGEAVIGADEMDADLTYGPSYKEDGLVRSAIARYANVRVQALEFHDVSGAKAAFTLLLDENTKAKRASTTSDIAASKTVTLLRAGAVVLLAQTSNSALAEKISVGLPKISGPRSRPPLLPTLLPAKGLVVQSVHYAMGPVGYAAEGGELDGGTLGWEKNAEVAFAQYADRRGKETLTLLLYPTPQIAAEHTRALQAAVAGAKVRREGELVAVAQGSFDSDAAQNLVENIHLRSEVTFDKNITPAFPTELKKTYSLLTSIAVLSGVGMLAAVLLGLFLGVGRASFRKMRGKDAASEAEFLSLHLDPQNASPQFQKDARDEASQAEK